MTTMTLTKREDFPTSDDWPTLTGKQTPMNLREAPGSHEHGRKTVELARRAGVTAMPWQAHEIHAINATHPDGSWVHSDAILICPRQNGKSLIVALIVIYRIFVLGQNVLFTAHQWETAKELWQHTWKIVQGRRFLMKLVTSYTCSQGRGTIFLSNGGRVVFTTRSQDAGRGLTKVDLLVYDEGYNCTDAEVAALAFLSQAAPDPQVFFMSSAVHRDFPQHQNGKVLSAMRAQALEDFDPEEPIYLSEYAANEGLDPEDEETWREANPSYGVIATAKKLRRIMKRMNTETGRRNFGVEALGWGLWFIDGAGDDIEPAVTDEELTAIMPTTLPVLTHTVIAVDATPERTFCSIALGGRTEDGKTHGIIGYHGPLIVAHVVEVIDEVCNSDADPMCILIDPKSPAEVLIAPLEKLGWCVIPMKWVDVKSSTVAMLQGIDDKTYSMASDQTIRDGFASAVLREDREGGVAWSRQGGVISQVVALSFAMWGVARHAPLPKSGVVPVALPAAVESVEVEPDFAF